MPEKKELTRKEKLNIVFFFCVVFQRSIVVITRKCFGLQALGRECAFALFLMLIWAALSQDVLMYGWIALWCVCLAQRRMEATRLFKNGAPVNSYSDGLPINLGKDMRMAALWYEPVCTAILGAFLFWLYEQNGWPSRGLPCFLFWGAITMRVVESVKQKAHERRLMAMSDARLEQEWLVREHGDKFGN